MTSVMGYLSKDGPWEMMISFSLSIGWGQFVYPSKFRHSDWSHIFISLSVWVTWLFITLHDTCFSLELLPRSMWRLTPKIQSPLWNHSGSFMKVILLILKWVLMLGHQPWLHLLRCQNLLPHRHRKPQQDLWTKIGLTMCTPGSMPALMVFQMILSLWGHHGSHQFRVQGIPSMLRKSQRQSQVFPLFHPSKKFLDPLKILVVTAKMVTLPLPAMMKRTTLRWRRLLD